MLAAIRPRRAAALAWVFDQPTEELERFLRPKPVLSTSDREIARQSAEFLKFWRPILDTRRDPNYICPMLRCTHECTAVFFIAGPLLVNVIWEPLCLGSRVPSTCFPGWAAPSALILCSRPARGFVRAWTIRSTKSMSTRADRLFTSGKTVHPH